MYKTNKRIGLKLAVVALIAVLATVGVLIPMLNRTSIAYASTQGTPATFLTMRRGTRVATANDRAFAAYDFQRNDTNFHHIEAAAIANLNDNHHNRTLRQQSDTITSAVNRNRISTIPLLTIITHGQGGRLFAVYKTYTYFGGNFYA